MSDAPQLIPPSVSELEARIEKLLDELRTAQDELLVTAVYAREQRLDQARRGVLSPASDVALETIAREALAAAMRVSELPPIPDEALEVPRNGHGH